MATLRSPDAAIRTAAAALAATGVRPVQAVVLILLPRCAGKFGADGTGGKASIKAVAVELWMSCAFFNTAMPTACLVPVSASPVANWAIPVTSMCFSNQGLPRLTANSRITLALV